MLVIIKCKVCGHEKSVFPSAIKAGRGKTCSRACMAKSHCNMKHGQCHTRLYQIWSDMKARCTKGSANAHYYHDRGISVCVEWQNSFIAFRDWAVVNGYAEKLEIDRRDNDKGYSPDNCRWATRTQQMTNTRKRQNAKTSRFKGVSWCANAGKWRAQIRQGGIHNHIGLYWSEEEAALAYDAEARRMFGEFGVFNFKERGASF